jgi:hypothetical protein
VGDINGARFFDVMAESSIGEGDLAAGLRVGVTRDSWGDKFPERERENTGKELAGKSRISERGRKPIEKLEGRSREELRRQKCASRCLQ